LRRISIIVLNWNGKDLLEECLPSVVDAARAYDSQTEVIVVDNASTDDSVAFLRANFPQVKVIQSKKNLGFAGGCNLGVTNASHDIVILLNNDMKVDINFIEPLVKPFDDSDVFAVSSQIYFWDKKAIRQETGLTFGYFAHGSLQVGHDMPPDDVSKVMPILYAGGGSSVFDKQKFEELGGFDELFYPFYGEDADLSYRAWKRGWRVLFAPDSVVYHKHRGTIGRTHTASYIESIVEKNRLLFFWKNVTDRRELIKHCVFIPLNILHGIMAGKPFAKAFLLALKQLPEALRKRLHERRKAARTDKEVLWLTNPLGYEETFKLARHYYPNERKKILFITPFFPNPPIHGGAMRMNHMIRGLCEDNDLYLLSFAKEDIKKEDIHEMEKYCKKVEALDYEPACPLGFFPFKPGIARGYQSSRLRKKLEQMIAFYDIDIVQAEYIQMAQYAFKSKDIPLILTNHEVNHLAVKFDFRKKGLANKLKTLFIYLQSINYEIRACRNFDRVIALTDTDKAALSPYLKEDIHILPTGVDIDYFKPRGDVEDGAIVYVGYFGHYPNVDSMLYFTSEVFPLVKEKYPNAKLYIVGSMPTEEIKNLASNDIIVTGFVDDLREYLDKASVFIAPIRFGAGFRGKVLQALAAGKAVVSTSLGAEGLGLTHGETILIADDSNGFAEAVVSVLDDKRLREKLAHNGRRAIENKYSWQAIFRRQQEIWDEALKKKRELSKAHTLEEVVR